MFEIIALMKPVQLKESSVSDAIDTPAIKVIDYISSGWWNIKADSILYSDLSSELALPRLRNWLQMHIHRCTHALHTNIYIVHKTPISVGSVRGDVCVCVGVCGCVFCMCSVLEKITGSISNISHMPELWNQASVLSIREVNRRENFRVQRVTNNNWGQW